MADWTNIRLISVGWLNSKNVGIPSREEVGTGPWPGEKHLRLGRERSVATWGTLGEAKKIQLCLIGCARETDKS